ncbi:MAG: hypothetical protein SFX18_01470 [Pirellulales bacterium]|nr:hypothetical protein [Pirellulales bacterium]
MGFGKYLKTAFLNHWNLLVMGAGVALSLMTDNPEIGLSLVAAGEVAYLGMLSTNPKFQSYVEAQEAKATRATVGEESQKALERIMQTLPRESLDRFLQLRQRCLELEQIAGDLRQPGELPAVGLENFQTEGLDRLLWLHLRLLYTHQSLARFLNKTSDDQIEVDIRRSEQRLAEYPADSTNPQEQRIRQTLLENLQTSRDRLENLQKARANFELVKVQIEALENKIRSLSELAVNRHEPEFISTQVNQIANSMVETEKTMNELQYVTGLATAEETPGLLKNKMLVTR